jgi:uncharacterized protein
MPVVYITKKCNLKCKYCYVQKDNITMSWKIAKKTIDFLGSLNYKRRVVSLFGGEPLIEWKFVKKLVDYIEKTGKFSDIFLCTNGVLLNESKIKYFIKHKVTPQISIDGIAIAHNANRVDKLNRPTFSSLDKNLRLIGQKYIDNLKNLQLRITISPQSIYYLYETVKYILSINLMSAQINMLPDVHAKYAKFDFNQLVKQLALIAKLAKYLRRDGKLLNLNYNECIVQGSNFESMRKPSWKPFCHLGNQMLSVDIDGSIYPCYISVGITKNKRNALKLGTIYEGIKYPSKLIDLDYSDAFNPYLSCLIWNYEKNGKLLKPIRIYKEMYNAWVNAYNLFWN